MLEVERGSLQLVDCVLELLKQGVEVVFRLLYQVVEDSLDEVIAVVNQLILEQTAIQDNELFLFLCMSSPHIIKHIMQALNGFLVSLHWIRVHLILIPQQYTFPAPLGPDVVQLSELLRHLPLLPIILHIRLYILNPLQDVCRGRLNVLIGRDPFLILRLGLIGLRQLPPLLPFLLLLFLGHVLIMNIVGVLHAASACTVAALAASDGLLLVINLFLD